MPTYITKRPVGLTRDIVVRTDESRQRASRRAVLRTPTFDPLKGPVRSAQDVADEMHLSRSKPYFEKGKREAARRFEREQRRMLKLESRHLQTCADFDAEKIEQEAEAA